MSKGKAEIASLSDNANRYQFLVFGRYLYGKKAGRVNRKSATTIEVLGNDISHAIERLRAMCVSDDGQTVQFQVVKRVLTKDELAEQAERAASLTENETEAEAA